MNQQIAGALIVIVHSLAFASLADARGAPTGGVQFNKCFWDPGAAGCRGVPGAPPADAVAPGQVINALHGIAAETMFVKPGNNGTVSCDRFCAGSQWGATGTCALGLMDLAPTQCDVAPGLLHTQLGLSCICLKTFSKPGNNGTASCDRFCAGKQWGPIGNCLSASRGDNGQPLACDAALGLTKGGVNCTCGPAFQKPGNNGAVSCSTYCQGRWGNRQGRCFTAARGDNGAKVSCDTALGVVPGGLDCTCLP